MNRRFDVRIVLLLFVSVIFSVLGFILLKSDSIGGNSSSSIYGNEDRKIDSLLNYNLPKAQTLINEIGQSYSGKTIGIEGVRSNYYKIAVLLKKNDLDSIPIIYNQILNQNINYKNEYYEAKVNRLMGVYCYYTNDIPRSLEFLLQAKSYFKKDKDNLMLGHIYSNLGSVYYILEKFDISYSHFDEAECYFDLEQNHFGQTAVLANKARIELSRGNLEKAKSSLLKAVETFRSQKDTINTIRSLSILSYAELQRKNSDSALHYIDQAYKLSEKINDSIFQSLCLTHYGNIYNFLDKNDKAIYFYKKGYEFSSNKAMNLERLKDLSQVLEEEGDYKESLNYLKEYYQQKDSVFGAIANKKVFDLEKISALKELKEDQISLNFKHERSKLIYTFTILIISIGMISIWLMYTNKNKNFKISKLENTKLLEKVRAEKKLKKLKKQQYEMELKSQMELQKVQMCLSDIEKKSKDFENQSQREIQALQDKQYKIEINSKNRELITMNFQLVAKSKILNDIDELIEKIPEKFKYLLKDIKTTIRETRKLNSDWELFKELFEQIHPDFFTNLSAKYPELTKAEIRICTYIKINMDNNNICYLLNISHQTLISNRYKIRKKMNLTSRSEDLDDFIRFEV